MTTSSLVSSSFADALSAHSLAGGGIDVDVDLSVFVQVALFALLAFALKPLLFDPLLKLFEEREKRIEGARAESFALDKASAEAQGRYEAAMQEARGKANTERDKLRSEGVRRENEILAEARAVTGKKLEDGRSVLGKELESARTHIQKSADELGAQIASRVLGREIR